EAHSHDHSHAGHSHSAGHTQPTLRFFFSSRRRHTRSDRDWSSDVCSSDLKGIDEQEGGSPWAPPSCSSIPLARGNPSLAFTMIQIGRASCRERVWNWVVAA